MVKLKNGAGLPEIEKDSGGPSVRKVFSTFLNLHELTPFFSPLLLRLMYPPLVFPFQLTQPHPNPSPLGEGLKT